MVDTIWPLAISGGIVLGVGGYIISTFNYFRTTKEAIRTQMSNLVTEYERRVDVFLNYSQTVKSYKKHEAETLLQVSALRSGTTPEKKGIEYLKKIETFLSGLKINVEAYPTLKSNEQHNAFLEQIKETEDRIQGAKTGYNTVVREYNSYVKTFPSNIVGLLFKIREERYYETYRSWCNQQLMVEASKATKVDL